MSPQIILVIFFSLIIHMVSTLSYSVRIVGIRTKKIDSIYCNGYLT